jgi:Fe-S-cluster containining protein
MPPSHPLSCARCGTCCRAGGPALHLEDRRLVTDGVIHTRHLFTIRTGETARDPVGGGLVRAAGDIIKIKGCEGTWACRFLDAEGAACRIYTERPLECRSLECRDPSRLEGVYGAGRLSRLDLLTGVEGLWELIRDHDRRCDCDQARRLLAQRRADAGRELAEMVRYDEELRRLMVARGGLEVEMLDFLLGRPMSLVVRLMQREDGAAEPSPAPTRGE